MTTREAELILVELAQAILDSPRVLLQPGQDDTVLTAIRTLTFDDDYGTDQQEAA